MSKVSKAQAAEEKEQLIEREIDELKQQLSAAQTKHVAARGVYQQLVARQETARKLEQMSRQMAELAQQPPLTQESPLTGEVLAGMQSVNQHYAAFVGRIDHQIEEFKQHLKQAKDHYEAAEKTVSKTQARLRELTDELERTQPVVRSRTVRRVGDDGVERAYVILYRREVLMPWSESARDRDRFRKILVRVTLLMILLSFILPFIPLPEEPKVVEIPERMARLVQEQKPPPPPPPPPPQKLAEQKVDQLDKTKVKPQGPAMEGAAVARERAQRSGLLAFSGSLTDLMDNPAEAKLGKQAKLTSAGTGGTARRTERSLITSGVTRGSGGINTASLSRDVAGSGLGQGGVGTSRVTGFIGGSTFGDADKPLTAESIRGSRTDEEIQIIFDRNKSALYSIYQRALRVDPTLKGKVVLKITIAPSGKVMAASVESSDLNDKDLEQKIAARVKLFDFGVKDVDTITIVYPVEFLPA
jgi:hypothetical protein